MFRTRASGGQRCVVEVKAGRSEVGGIETGTVALGVKMEAGGELVGLEAEMTPGEAAVVGDALLRESEAQSGVRAEQRGRRQEVRCENGEEGEQR
jgi:hypothetical protein